MTSSTSQVIIGYDFSHSAREAMYRAILLARQTPAQALHFVCVIEPHAALPSLPAKHVDYPYAERVQQALTDVIAEELKAAGVTDRVHFYVHARIGKPAVEILALAREVGADLIVVGSKGLTGIERLVLGSVAEKVVREAHCTVEVARAKTYDYVQRLEVIDATTPHVAYVPPHRYTYEDRSICLRPLEWPLY